MKITTLADLEAWVKKNFWESNQVANWVSTHFLRRSTYEKTAVKLTGDQEISGKKTFKDDITAAGNLTVNGATATVNTLVADTVHHSSHSNGYRSRSYVIDGRYISSSRINLAAFDVGGFQPVLVRASYGQFNTGTASDEPVLGLGVAVLTADNSNIVLTKTAELGAQHVTLGIEKSGHRACIYLNRTGGTSFRGDSAQWRICAIEIIGNIANLVLNPTTI